MGQRRQSWSKRSAFAGRSPIGWFATTHNCAQRGARARTGAIASRAPRATAPAAGQLRNRTDRARTVHRHERTSDARSQYECTFNCIISPTTRAHSYYKQCARLGLVSCVRKSDNSIALATNSLASRVQCGPRSRKFVASVDSSVPDVSRVCRLSVQLIFDSHAAVRGLVPSKSRRHEE